MNTKELLWNQIDHICAPKYSVQECWGGTVKINKILKNACICCSGDITVTWTNTMSKEFALATDVCSQCYELGCPGISPHNEDEVHACFKVKNNRVEL